MGLTSSVLKVLQKAIAHKIHRESFHRVSSKLFSVSLTVYVGAKIIMTYHMIFQHHRDHSSSR